MTHAEAVQELRAMAAGKVCSLQYETADYYEGGYQIEAYIESYGHVAARTYRGAIEMMVIKMRDMHREELPPEVEK